jgi:hypothetical protein
MQKRSETICLRVYERKPLVSKNYNRPSTDSQENRNKNRMNRYIWIGSINLPRSESHILILNTGIILIAISFLATLWRLACEKVRVGGFQSAFLQASVGHGVIIALSTEVLSKFRQMNFMSLCIL